MVGPQPSSHRTALSRRTALSAPAAVAATSLAGCGDGAGPGSPSPASADPDEQTLRRAVSSEERLRAQVRAASRRHRQLRPALAAVDNVHGEHVAFLVRSFDRPVPSSGGAPPPTPRSPRAAVRALVRSEQALAQAHAAAALGARSGPFARVLAGMAAAAEQQAHVLDALTRPGRRRG